MWNNTFFWKNWNSWIFILYANLVFTIHFYTPRRNSSLLTASLSSAPSSAEPRASTLSSNQNHKPKYINVRCWYTTSSPKWITPSTQQMFYKFFCCFIQLFCQRTQSENCVWKVLHSLWNVITWPEWLKGMCEEAIWCTLYAYLRGVEYFP